MSAVSMCSMKQIGNEHRHEVGRHLHLIAAKIHIFTSDEESGRCRDSGECIVFRISRLLTPLYATLSISKGTFTPGQTSKLDETPRFVNHPNFLSPDT